MNSLASGTKYAAQAAYGGAAAAYRNVPEMSVVKDVAKAGVGYARANPGTAACVATGAVGVSMFAAPGIITGAAVSTLGFGSGGVQAASVASVIQGSIGNVAAGSLFATAQSAGAGGAGAAVIAGAVQGTGGILTGLSGVMLGRTKLQKASNPTEGDAMGEPNWKESNGLSLES